jgi:uroporphyrinogen-III synthase
VRRVAVTTSADTSGPPADAVARAGLVPVLLPCIEVTPAAEHVLDEARREAKAADFIVITSGRTVTVVWPDGSMPPTPVAAVGAATARAVKESGGVVAATGRGGGEDLVLGVELRGRKVLYLHAADATPGTAAALATSGADLVDVVVYGVTPIAPGPDPVEAVMFGSPSAVQGWVSRRRLDGLVVGAIGPTTAAALADRSVSDVVLPPRPSFEVMAGQMAERMRK